METKNTAGQKENPSARRRCVCYTKSAYCLGMYAVLGLCQVLGAIQDDTAADPYARSQEALAKLAPQAAAAKVAIGIENVWNRFLLSPLETARFLDEIGSPWVGMYLDVGNVVYLGYPEQWVELLAKHIKKLHMSDYRFDQAGIGAFVDLFAGDVDFPAVAKAIAAIGYDDYITLEMLPNYKQFPEVSLYADKYAMDKIAQMVREAR